MTTPAEIILFGGSFDPPHVAHAMAVTYALAVRPEADIWVVPTFAHALGKQATATFEQRCAMAETAFGEFPRVRISSVEQQLERPSRTLHTLQHLQGRYPETVLHLLVGSDILAEQHRWYRFDEIERCSNLLVIGRPGYPHGAPFTLPDISSTQLRADLVQGVDVTGRLHQGVCDYIAKHRLYRVADSAADHMLESSDGR